MEVLELQFRVQGYPTLDQTTRQELLASSDLSALPHGRIRQIWGSSVPNQFGLSVQVQQSAVFLTEDWVASIHGPKLIDCVGTMCGMVSTLDEVLGASVTIELLTAHNDGGNTLYRQLDREKTVGRFRAAGFWVLTLGAGGLAGALAQWAIA